MLDQYGNALVTGGLGFIGHHLAMALHGLGKAVTVVDNAVTATGRPLPSGATLISADIADASQIRLALTAADLVFHVAGNASGTLSVTNPRFDFETNALGTFNVLEAALLANVKRFVYVSSASVYGRPASTPMNEEHRLSPFIPYGASKLAGELACTTFCQAYGLPVMVGRPFCVYGPGENPKVALVEVARYLRWHLNGQPIQVVGDVDAKIRDFVHVEDVVEALLLIADGAAPGEIFNIGSGECVSMRQLTEVIGEATGHEAMIKTISEITDDTYSLVADISKLRAIGYRPQWALGDGISDLARQLGDKPELPGGATIFKMGQRAEGPESGPC